MSDDAFPKYPHLENLNRATQVLGAPFLRVTEKIHGFNARLGRDVSGKTWIGMRNTVVTRPGTSQGFYEWAVDVVDRLSAGITLYGEWAGTGIQKGIDYGEPSFYLFDLLDANGLWRSWDDVKFFATVLGIKTVPLIFDGASSHVTMEMLDAWRQGDSLVAPGQTREGIVIRPTPDVVDEYGRSLVAEFKSPNFEERASARRAEPTPVDLTNVSAFVEEYGTEMRLQHVFDQLRESGVDPLDRKNRGDVLKAMYDDVVREGQVDFAALSEADQKLVGKVLSRATSKRIETIALAEVGVA